MLDPAPYLHERLSRPFDCCDGSISDKHAALAVEAGAMQAVVAIMRTHSDNASVVKQACKALGRIIADRGAIADRNFLDFTLWLRTGPLAGVNQALAGAINALVAVMTKHVDNASVMEPTRSILRSFCCKSGAFFVGHLFHFATMDSLSALF